MSQSAGMGGIAVEAGVEPDVPVQVLLGFERSVGYAVDADELGGDALAHLGIVVGLAEDGEAGVGMEVDETGADDVSGGVDDAAGVAAEVGVVAAMDGDGVAGDGDGRFEAGAAGAVDDFVRC